MTWTSQRLIERFRRFIVINGLDDDLFSPALPRARAVELFKKYIDDVELENHSYCNRTCWFCPNSFIDRRSHNVFMSDAVYNKILVNLAEIAYSGTLEWSGYAEHFAYTSFLTRLSGARAALPLATLMVFTNGDYLNEELVDTVFAFGVVLHVDIYPPEGDEFNEEKIAAALSKFCKRTKLTLVPQDVNGRGWGDYAIFYKGNSTESRLKVGRYSTDNILTRAGALDIAKKHTYLRHSICTKPVFHLNVNHNGKGMLCCNTRSDLPEHSSAIICDLSDPDEDLFSFFVKLAPARLALLDGKVKTGICASCDDDAAGSPSGMFARSRIASAMVGGLKRLRG